MKKKILMALPAFVLMLLLAACGGTGNQAETELLPEEENSMEQADLQATFRILPPPCRRTLSFQIMFSMCIGMTQLLQKKTCKAG